MAGIKTGQHSHAQMAYPTLLRHDGSEFARRSPMGRPGRKRSSIPLLTNSKNLSATVTLRNRVHLKILAGTTRVERPTSLAV